MNRITAFILLDIPLGYRILLLFTSFLGVVCFSFDDHSRYYGVMAFSWTLFYSMILLGLFVFEQFVVTVKYGLETLYSTLPLTRGDIVKVRYLCFVCVQMILPLPALLMNLLFFPNNVRIYYFVSFAFLTVSFFAALTYPLFFKFSRQSILLGGVVFVSVSGIFGGLFMWFGHSLWKIQSLISAPVIIIMSAAAGFILIYLSYLLSLKIYRTKDL